MGTIKRTFANNVLTDGKIDATDLSGTIPASNIANASVTAVTALPSALGGAIESVATDPVSPSEGQLWYNTTIGVLKVYDGTLAAWAAGGNLATARRGLVGAGTQTAGLGFGGYGPPGNGERTSTEEYDGTSWSPGGDMGTGRFQLAGAGTQTAGLGFGGYGIPKHTLTEEYDGTSWSPGGNLNTGRQGLAGCGTQTAALGFGGYTPTLAERTSTEKYNGSTWTTSGNLGTARYVLAGCGTQTAGLAFGGGAAITGATEEFNGSTWSAGGTMNQGRSQLAGCGTQTSALAFGGITPTRTAVTESYDGTSWITTTSLSTAKNLLAGGGGTNTAGLAFGGLTAPTTDSAATEEFTGAFLSVKKVTLT